MNIVFIIYNRPEHTRQVWDAIVAARPSRLFIVADGANSAKPNDSELVSQVREVVRDITWPCEVQRNYAPVNMGCGPRVSSGLDWVFSSCSDAIILEDDCLPAPDFFPFCREMLGRYASDSRVLSACGFNALGQWPGQDQVVSCLGGIWGWATWARAWAHYRFNMADHGVDPATADLTPFFGNRFMAAYFKSLFSRHMHYHGTWDFQWLYAKFLHGGLSVIPPVNLIRNIGFDHAASHHNAKARHFAAMPVGAWSKQQDAPTALKVDRAFDERSFRRMFEPDDTLQRWLFHARCVRGRIKR